MLYLPLFSPFIIRQTLIKLPRLVLNTQTGLESVILLPQHSLHAWSDVCERGSVDNVLESVLSFTFTWVLRIDWTQVTKGVQQVPLPAEPAPQHRILLFSDLLGHFCSPPEREKLLTPTWSWTDCWGILFFILCFFKRPGKVGWEKLLLSALK